MEIDMNYDLEELMNEVFDKQNIDKELVVSEEEIIENTYRKLNFSKKQTNNYL